MGAVSDCACTCIQEWAGALARGELEAAAAAAAGVCVLREQRCRGACE